MGGQWGHFTERGRCAGRGVVSENLDVFSASSQKPVEGKQPRGVDKARSPERGLCCTERLGDPDYIQSLNWERMRFPSSRKSVLLPSTSCTQP